MKTSLFVVTSDRASLLDGRVVDKVVVDLKGKSTYRWQCICRPEDKHDHQPFIDRIAAGLANRQEVIAPLAALVGTTVGDATITDCNIQIRGPADWPLYVAWKYSDGRTEERSFAADEPHKTPAPSVVLDVVKTAVAETENRRKAAAGLVAFEGEASDVDPLLQTRG